MRAGPCTVTACGLRSRGMGGLHPRRTALDAASSDRFSALKRILTAIVGAVSDRLTRRAEMALEAATRGKLLS